MSDANQARALAALSSRDASASDCSLNFLLAVGLLKVEKRTGWVRAGVHRPESIADHMYRMATAALVLGCDDAEAGHLASMALVHDLAEAVVGDITPDDKRYTKEQKHELERQALEDMLRPLPPAASSRIRSLYLEYEAQASPGAWLVKDLDRLDMALQAYEYERDQPHMRGRLGDFFDSVRGKFRSPAVAAWAQEVEARRTALLQQGAQGAPGHGLAGTDESAPRPSLLGSPWVYAAAGVLIGAVSASLVLARRR